MGEKRLVWLVSEMKFGLAHRREEVWFGGWAAGEVWFGCWARRSLVWLMVVKKFGLADVREEVWFG
jgi:hypothetical protein